MTTTADSLASTYRFADLTLDVARRRVTRRGETIELKTLDFDLLCFLVESAPNVVNADVLAEKVWGRHFVSPENVAQRVMLLRQSLADDANRPRYIETVRNKGYRLVPVVERTLGVTKAAEAPRRRRWAVAAAMLAAVALAATAPHWLTGARERPPTPPSSVAVLPFENLSPNPGEAFFAAGMQDAIVSQLTKIDGLRVVPLQAAPAATQGVARGVNVATTLGGTVSYSAGRVRVIPQLVDTATGVSLWSNSYDRELSDIFAIQSEISLEVAHALSLKLSPTARMRIERPPTRDPRARDLYLIAKARTPLSPEVLLAIAEVEQALALDGEFKEAWLLDAHVRNFAQFVDPEHADEHRRHAAEAARRAIDIDPEFGQAHAALGWTLVTNKDWTGAEAAFRKAVSLNVPKAEMGAYASLQLDAGLFNAFAHEIYDEARAAAPQNELFHRMLAFMHENRGEWARANAIYESALRLFENDPRATLNLVNQQVHWLVGRKKFAEARAIRIDDALNAEMLANLDSPERALAVLREQHAVGGSPVRRRDIGVWAAHFGDPALAFEALSAAIDAQGGQMLYMWLPQLEAVRRLPEFEAYMREIGMVQYWQQYGWPPLCRPLDRHAFECE